MNKWYFPIYTYVGFYIHKKNNMFFKFLQDHILFHYFILSLKLFYLNNKIN